MLSVTSEIVIRSASGADRAQVATMSSDSLPTHLAGLYPAALLQVALPNVAEPSQGLIESGSYFVVEKAGQIVGAGGWTQTTPMGHAGRAHLGHVRHVIVDAQHVRQGIGGHLLQHIRASSI